MIPDQPGSDFPVPLHGLPQAAPARLDRAVLGPLAASTCALSALPPTAIAATAAAPTTLVPACRAARRRRTWRTSRGALSAITAPGRAASAPGPEWASRWSSSARFLVIGGL